MLPIIKSAFPFLADCILAASSGKLVPIATIVNPIISSEIFKIFAIFSALTTAYFDPRIKERSPITR